MKKTIIVVGNYQRKDYLDLFKECKNQINFYFIEFLSKNDIDTYYHEDYGEAIFWKDFSSAYNLLEKIKPNKVLFFFIESFNHVALNVACKERNIPTYHLEHGVRDYRITSLRVKTENIDKKYNLLSPLKKISSLRDIIFKYKNRAFYLNTIKEAEQSSKAFLKNYLSIRRENNIFDTFSKINSPYRTADSYISFSPEIYKSHKIADHLSEGQPVEFIGIPYFDDWVGLKKKEPTKTIIYISQPFVDQNLFGWDENFEQSFITTLVEICNKLSFKLFVKLHPLEKNTYWNKGDFKEVVQIVDMEELKVKAQETPIVIGSVSTLLLPFVAYEHTVLFTAENHPNKEIFPSKFLVNNKVATPFFSFSELESMIINLPYYRQKQIPYKKEFISNWLYCFDGLAGVRLRNILLN